MAKTSCTAKLISGEEGSKILSQGKDQWEGRKYFENNTIYHRRDFQQLSYHHMDATRQQKRQREQRDWENQNPTPVFLPVESQGQRSLAGYCPWGCESQTWPSD